MNLSPYQAQNITISDCTFKSCISTSQNDGGGAIFIVYGFSRLSILNTLLGECHSIRNGGAVRVNLFEMYISGCCFYNCYCSSSSAIGNAASIAVFSASEMNSTFYLQCPCTRSYGHASCRIASGSQVVQNCNVSHEHSNSLCGINVYLANSIEFRSISLTNLTSAPCLDVSFEKLSRYTIEMVAIISCFSPSGLVATKINNTFYSEIFFFGNSRPFFNNSHKAVAHFSSCSFDASASDVASDAGNYCVISDSDYSETEAPSDIVSASNKFNCRLYYTKVVHADTTVSDIVIFSSVGALMLGYVVFNAIIVGKKAKSQEKADPKDLQLRMTLPISEEFSSEEPKPLLSLFPKGL